MSYSSTYLFPCEYFQVSEVHAQPGEVESHDLETIFLPDAWVVQHLVQLLVRLQIVSVWSDRYQAIEEVEVGGRVGPVGFRDHRFVGELVALDRTVAGLTP